MTDLVIKRCGPNEVDLLLPLVIAYHVFEQIEMENGERRRSLAALLSDPLLGEVWCALRTDWPIGYVAVCFGYSMEFCGRDAFVDELFVLPEERGKGIGGRLLKHVKARMAAAGTVAIHLEVARQNIRAKHVYAQHGFVVREKYHLMSLKLG